MKERYNRRQRRGFFPAPCLPLDFFCGGGGLVLYSVAVTEVTTLWNTNSTFGKIILEFYGAGPHKRGEFKLGAGLGNGLYVKTQRM